MPRLIVEKGYDKGKSIPLSPKGAFVFGRDTSAQVQIRDPMASRTHFKIESRTDSVWISDLQSLNGTLLNGQPVREARLKGGDLIRVGETMYSFLEDDGGADPLIQQRIGGYRILERVGRGGMGTVYKAEQIDLQRIVALKIISPEHVQKKDFVELFVREARAAAKLNHPNIVQVYDVKKFNDLYYFSMEFVPGGSVQELLSRQRKLPVPDAVRMILDAARGFEYAHKKDVIHRDVKPDNFMIGESGQIKIGDLGLAQRLGEKLSTDDDRTVIGTPHYIAPELVLGKPADYRSDIYSLGATMFRMIAGFTPYQAPTVSELVNKKVREDSPSLAGSTPGVPPRLSAVCAKMMARRPEERTSSMSEVIADLERAVQEPERKIAPVKFFRESRRFPVSAAILAVLVAGAAVAAMAVIRNRSDAPDGGRPPAAFREGPEDEKSAELKLDLARVMKAKLDPKSPEDFLEVIKLFEVIVERWPGSPWAEAAARDLEELRGRRREFAADQRFAALEQADREAWSRLLQAFQSGQEDLAEAEQSMQAYRNFSLEEEAQGTGAAQKAAARAERIRQWKEELDRRRTSFEATRAAVEALLQEGRYQVAWELYDKYVSDTPAVKPEPKDRYNTLLYDLLARREQERILEMARRRYAEIERLSRQHEEAGDFAKAIEVLDPVIRDSVAEPAKKALQRSEALSARWSEAKQLAARRLAEERSRREADDARDFEAYSRKWRKLVLDFDPRPAAEEAARLGAAAVGDAFPRLEAWKDRAARRGFELKLLADFKDTMVRLWNDSKNQGVYRAYTYGRMSGTIVQATDRQLSIRLAGGGRGDIPYRDLLQPPDELANFLQYLQICWRGGDVRWNMGLAILCFECGHFERAAEQIKYLEKTGDAEAQRFVNDYRPLAEEQRYHDCDEVEAQKHFDRLLAGMRETDPPGGIRPDPDRALAALRTRYAHTTLYANQRAKIEEIEKILSERGGKERERKIREERYRKIQGILGTVQADVKAREESITAAIRNLSDPVEMRYHLGEALHAHRDLKGSTASLVEALNTAVKRVPPSDRRGPDPAAYLMAGTGVGLMRNYVLSRQTQAANEVREKVSRHLCDDAGKEHEWWTRIKAEFDQWVKEYHAVIAKYGEKLEPLEDALRNDADAPRLWTLAAHRETLRDYIAARGLYQALIELYPDYSEVKNGNALYRLAEATFRFHDLPRAKELYQKVQLEHPQHPKVTADRRVFDGVASRLNQCADLEKKMQSLK
ncbi:MAG: protein kinase [Planctomycetes bacterium]|nr:protein kinase [Planctomycetota bacterium]